MTYAPIQGKCPVCHQDSANTAFQAGAAIRDAEVEGWKASAENRLLIQGEREKTIAELREQVTILQHEVDAARHSKERAVRILTGIHALLHPPIFTDRDGKMWQFKSPIIEEQMQALSDRIRAIPEEIDAINATEQKP
jgi:hypothetical protein